LGFEAPLAPDGAALEAAAALEDVPLPELEPEA